MMISTGNKFSSPEILRGWLRVALTHFEFLMDKVVKKIAIAHGPWKDTWEMELKQSVGEDMANYVSADKELDAYSISQILKKHLKGVYLKHTKTTDDDFFTESLRNGIHHLGYTRYLLFHNGQPSIGEVVSCLYVCEEVCSAFENVVDSAIFATVNHKLENIILLAKESWNLSVGATKLISVDHTLFFSLVLDKVLSTFEEIFVPVCMNALSSSSGGSAKIMDCKEICKKLKGLRRNHQFRELTIKVKNTKRKGLPLIPLTTDQLDELDTVNNDTNFYYEIAFQKVIFRNFLSKGE